MSTSWLAMDVHCRNIPGKNICSYYLIRSWILTPQRHLKLLCLPVLRRLPLFATTNFCAPISMLFSCSGSIVLRLFVFVIIHFKPSTHLLSCFILCKIVIRNTCDFFWSFPSFFDPLDFRRFLVAFGKSRKGTRLNRNNYYPIKLYLLRIMQYHIKNFIGISKGGCR